MFLPLRGDLDQALVSTLRQLWDDVSDTVLIENHGVTPDWGCNPFLVTQLFSMRTVSLDLLQSCRSVDTDTRYKPILKLKIIIM